MDIARKLYYWWKLHMNKHAEIITENVEKNNGYVVVLMEDGVTISTKIVESIQLAESIAEKWKSGEYTLVLG